MYVYMYKYVYVYTHINTHTHTNIYIYIHMYFCIYNCFGNPQIRVHYCIDRDTVNNQTTRASQGCLVSLSTQNLKQISKHTTNVQTRSI